MAKHHDILWAIMKSSVSASAKCAATVLLLKFYNPETGRCDPSFGTLAKYLGRTRRSAITAVNELKSAGWVEWKGSLGGSTANTNKFNFPNLPVKPATPVSSASLVKPTTHTGEVHGTLPVKPAAHELSIELSKNYEGEGRSRAKRLSNDFGLDQETREWALNRLGGHDAVEHSMFRFTNHYRQAAGSRGLSTDWMAKARLWIDDDAKKITSDKSVVAAGKRLHEKLRSFDAGSVVTVLSDDQWDGIVALFSKTGRWTKHVDQCGNAPPAADCRAPKHILAKYGLAEAAA